LIDTVENMVKDEETVPPTSFRFKGKFSQLSSGSAAVAEIWNGNPKVQLQIPRTFRVLVQHKLEQS